MPGPAPIESLPRNTADEDRLGSVWQRVSVWRLDKLISSGPPTAPASPMDARCAMKAALLRLHQGYRIASDSRSAASKARIRYRMNRKSAS